MKRQVLTDGTGRWFDLDKATKYEEATSWNGRNRISVATGSQWDHEALYLTESGRWIKHWWSQWQGSADQWLEISPEEAATWLIRNGHQLPESLKDYEKMLMI